MRTLVTVPEFRQSGPLLSFLDNAETETPSDKVIHSHGALKCFSDSRVLNYESHSGRHPLSRSGRFSAKNAV
jgi:hypothetical protein